MTKLLWGKFQTKQICIAENSKKNLVNIFLNN